MLLRLIFSYSGFLLLLSCSNFSMKSDLEISGLKGRVKILKELHTYHIRGYGDRIGINKDSLVITVSKYNEGGYIIEQWEYDEFNQLQKRKINSYNEEFKKEMIETYDGKNNLLEKGYLKYDKRGVEYSFFSPDKKLIEKNILMYDKRGRVAEQRMINSNGGLDWHETYDYNDNGNIKKQSIYNPTGKLLAEIFLEYNYKGDLTEKVDKSVGFSTHRFFFQYNGYDKNGNWLKQQMYYYNKVDKTIVREIEYY